ncbi:peptidoglycan-binding protein [Rhizobium sp. 32-5/1]|uniref:peptidoglycan-binding protein n=1 Tax=Rhizobium sp. 32-5/1 TaxID=3019602 RepID=UPI00240DAE4A|nr:peptidoglycan-binding protein [Rhizobium sp. 32-5/1]WEZ84569.1 peptidoglycan-binding protein [Rhizobium sp. 32-5/1]
MEFEQWLQSRLTAHGYPVGMIDGHIGPVTIDALKAFEKANGLTIDGAADPKVVAALRASASAVPPKIMIEIPNRDIVPAKETFQPSKTVWPRQSECMAAYGPVGQNQVQIEVPFDMFLAWSPSTRLRRMTLHRKVAASAERVLQRVAQIYNAKERASLGIDQFGGSLNVRKMRGGNSYSMHSWGIAIDFDPVRNGLHVHKPQARLSHADAVHFWVVWESEGWLSLGKARDFDWMHVQAARL